MNSRKIILKGILFLFCSLIVFGCSMGQRIAPSLEATHPVTSSYPLVATIETQEPSQAVSLALTISSTRTVLLTPMATVAGDGLGLKKSIIGTWERHNKGNNRPYTERFTFNKNGTYAIEARYDDTGEVWAENHGTFTFDQTTYTLTDKDHQTFVESYSLSDHGNTLITKNETKKPWTRISG
jgi:hypothetical protein